MDIIKTGCIMFGIILVAMFVSSILHESKRINQDIGFEAGRQFSNGYNFAETIHTEKIGRTHQDFQKELDVDKYAKQYTECFKAGFTFHEVEYYKKGNYFDMRSKYQNICLNSI